MKELKARAIVASEYPELRHCLAGVVQDKLGGIVAGEAENGVGTVALARTLRPDLIVVDDRLPYLAGLDGVRLSRIGGLDAALSIAQDLPRTRVLLVRDMGEAFAPDNGGDGRMELCLYRRPDSEGGHLEEQVIFAALRKESTPVVRSKATIVSEKGMLVGGLMMLGGLGLTLTIFLAPAGVVVAAAGGATLFLSWGARAVAAAWAARSRSRTSYVVAKGERNDIESSLQALPVI